LFKYSVTSHGIVLTFAFRDFDVLLTFDFALILPMICSPTAPAPTQGPARYRDPASACHRQRAIGSDPDHAARNRFGIPGHNRCAVPKRPRPPASHRRDYPTTGAEFER